MPKPTVPKQTLPVSVKTNPRPNQQRLFFQQRADWSPSLITQERYAKEHASVLFFVLDRRTRSLATMVEVAALVGTRPLVLTIEDQAVTDDITPSELADLQTARGFVRDLVRLCKVMPHYDIRVAIDDLIQHDPIIASPPLVQSKHFFFITEQCSYCKIIRVSFEIGCLCQPIVVMATLGSTVHKDVQRMNEYLCDVMKTNGYSKIHLTSLIVLWRK